MNPQETVVWAQTPMVPVVVRPLSWKFNEAAQKNVKIHHDD